MSEVQLYEGFVGAWGSENRASAIVLGVPFHLTQDYYILRFRWFRLSAGSGYAYTKMALYKLDGTTVVASFDAPDNGGAGWQEHTLTSSVLLTSGTDYVVAALAPAGTNVAYISAASRPTAPAGVSWVSAHNRQYKDSSTMQFPDGYDNSENYAIDVSLSTSPLGGSGGSGDPTLTGDLGAWLSADTENQEHQSDGLPWLTKIDTAAIATDTTAIKAVTDVLADIGSGAIAWLNTRATDAVDLLNGVNASAITALNDLAARITGSGAGGGSAFYSSDDRQVAQSAADTYDAVALLLALKRNALVDFPSSPWVMTDETAFDTDIAYTEEADLYVVTFTDLGSNLVNTVAAGVDVSYRLAWWSPLIGAFAQQRRFIDTPSAHLWVDGTRLPGVLLHSPAGAAGTIQAWLYA